MFKFLKLRNSNSGDARRHVPFASIIHNTFSVIFSLVFVFTIVSDPVKTKALAAPELQPVYDTTIEQLYEFVRVQLDDSQRQSFELLLGVYMVGYGGMADYKLNYSYNSSSTLKTWLINCGVDVYNTILSLGGIYSENDPSGSIAVPQIGYEKLSPLLNYAIACAYKADETSGPDDLLDEITNSNNYYVPLGIDVLMSLNNVFSVKGGLYQWQFSPADYSNLFSWNQVTLPNTAIISYQSYINQYFTNSQPIHANTPYNSQFVEGAGYFNVLCDITNIKAYNNIFFNVSENKAYLVNNSGSPIGHYYFNSPNTIAFYKPSSLNFNNSTVEYTTSWKFYPNNYVSFSGSNFFALAKQYITNGSFFGNNNNQFTTLIPDLGSYLNKIYYGTSWNTRQEVSQNDDLNIANPPTYESYLQGVENGLLDIKGLLADLIDNLNLKQPVINNYYYPNNDPVPVTDMEPASTGPSIPDSGIIVPEGIFAPFFDNGKGFISYMWYMTKPLISYTRSLLESLTFDPVDGFNASGPGYFILGVAGLGLIGGVIVKFLL